MKEVLLYLGAGIIIIFLLYFLVKLFAKKNYIILNSILGTAGLITLNLLSPLLNMDIGYSILNVGISLILGLPGVLLIVIERFI